MGCTLYRQRVILSSFQASAPSRKNPFTRKDRSACLIGKYLLYCLQKGLFVHSKIHKKQRFEPAVFTIILFHIAGVLIACRRNFFKVCIRKLLPALPHDVLKLQPPTAFCMFKCPVQMRDRILLLFRMLPAYGSSRYSLLKQPQKPAHNSPPVKGYPPDAHPRS